MDSQYDGNIRRWGLIGGSRSLGGAFESEPGPSPYLLPSFRASCLP
jgi:hypothetical protein